MSTVCAADRPATVKTGAPDRPTRVVTLTPAPAIDRIYLVDGLREGHVNRAHRIEAYIGGNGVNLARDLHAAGNEVSAIVPLNIDSVRELGDCLDFFQVVAVPHPARVNTVIITGDGVTTNVNRPPTR